MLVWSWLLGNGGACDNALYVPVKVSPLVFYPICVSDTVFSTLPVQ